MGYRTPASQKSDRHWRYANDSFHSYSYGHTACVLISQIIFLFTIPEYSVPLSYAVYTLGFVVIIYLVESGLKKLD